MPTDTLIVATNNVPFAGRKGLTFDLNASSRGVVRQGVTHELGLGILLCEGSMVVAEVSEFGECHGKVQVGDKVVGVNGVSLKDCMDNPGSPKEFVAMLEAAEEGSKVIINFNDLKKAPDLRKFKGVLKAGVQVMKYHKGKNGQDHRFLSMNKEETVLLVGKKVGAQKSKIFSVFEITRIIHTSECDFEFHTKGSDTIMLACVNKNTSYMLVQKVHAVVTELQAKHGKTTISKYTPKIQLAKRGSARK